MSCHWTFVLSFLIAVILADFVTSAVHWDEMLVKDTWNSVPDNWESLGNTTAGAIIDLHIALKPERERALIDTLSEVSNPRHPRYGAYLSKEQVADLVGPPADTVNLVRAWLIHHGIRPSSISMTHGGSWMTLTDVLVSQANQLLGASYQVYRNSKTGHTTIRTVSYALPAELHTRIRTVAPTTYFPSTRGMRQTPRRGSFGEARAQAAPGKVVTARQIPNLPGIKPSVLHWLYKTEGYYPNSVDKNKLGILGINDEYPSEDDLTSFMASYRSVTEGATFKVLQWNGGGYNPNNPSGGPSLGVQYAAAMTYPTPLIFYSVGGERQWSLDGTPAPGDVYREWFKNILEQPVPPQTISIEYGTPEQDLPIHYARSLCELFMELGARGVTVLVASGIDGVGSGECVNDQGRVRFIPEFPSSCPYVTSVGGTQIGLYEAAANLSGGGFSNHFDRDDYQGHMVMDYLRRFPNYPDPRFYNRDGRGYPDVSAHALDYQFFMNGEMHYMDGTTCAVSTVAGIVALLNDFLIFRKKHTLGFINPLLYILSKEKEEGINDVEFGANPGCNTGGFPAATGWDPVTGVGTLDFRKMLIAVDEWIEEDPNDPGEDPYSDDEPSDPGEDPNSSDDGGE